MLVSACRVPTQPPDGKKWCYEGETITHDDEYDEFDNDDEEVHILCHFTYKI